ncbi:RNA polymerase sigma factor [Undibacterium sp. Jales W-56]|uniref:RNA polymerase sigma factor n=1 Tax=Undibacterium sp. Jales W-56 TaxID=2897325 RepID=UPI0021D2BC31|nr:RNA polymerase sigma factor [Undibacterium sp. Jales W-56]MCU6435081.1 RNA polymerase sigma factor [Undibacterium sp. Jales W-56]
MDQTATNIQNEIAALLPRLRRFGRAVTRHREDADDLVQIAVEKALNRTEQWEPGSRLDSWLFRIMKNAWIDEVRGRARRSDILAPEEAGEQVGADPSDAYVHQLAVQKAVSMLNDDQRMVVSLVLVEGLPYKEAAEVMDIPIGTLTSRLARARETLQLLLSDPANK